jgi:uncharacterized delta-60 repeat protein
VQAADGRLLAAAGRFMVRLFADGSLDAGGRQLAVPLPVPAPEKALAPAERVIPSSRIAVTLAQPDGRIVSVGDVGDGFVSDIALTRHSAAGQPDPSFGTNGMQALGRAAAYESAADAVLQPDGKIVVVGTVQANQQESRDLLIARFNRDGSPDQTCARSGSTSIDLFEGDHDEGRRVALQADGKILVAAQVTYLKKPIRQTVIARFNLDCTLDRTFGEKGFVLLQTGDPLKLLVLPDGKILNVDQHDDVLAWLTRFDANGVPDASFGKEGNLLINMGPKSEALTAAALAGGKFLLVGRRYPQPTTSEAQLMRFDANGAPDASFGVAGMALTSFTFSKDPRLALALRGDGAIAIGGCSGDSEAAPVALFTANGVLDATFTGDGKTDLAIGGYTCARSATFSGGRLIVGGYAFNDPYSRFALAVYPTGEQRAVGFAAAQATAPESTNAATLTITLSQTAAQTVTVQYAATGGTATNGQDYTLPTGTLTFAPGQTTQRLVVPLINDAADEPDESVVIALSSPSNAVLGGTPSLTLTISDDDATPGPGPQWRAFLPLVGRP